LAGWVREGWALVYGVLSGWVCQIGFLQVRTVWKVVCGWIGFGKVGFWQVRRVWKVVCWWIGFGKVGFGKVGFEKVGFGKVGFGNVGFRKDGFIKDGFGRWGLAGWVWKGWVWQGWVGFGLCSLEGGEGGVLGWSGLVAGGRPHGYRNKAGCGGGGPGPLLQSLGGGGGRRVQAPPGLQRLRHLGGEKVGINSSRTGTYRRD
jgi:hypothetical protein